MNRFLFLNGIALQLLLVSGTLHADGEKTLDTFERHQLTDIYYSEGASAGDINGDGAMDIICGPHWYAGPDYKTASEIYPAVPQRREGYADNFFSWVYDFDRDGNQDVLTAGFPGTPGFVYRNPGKDGLTGLWEKLTMADQVGNEAPQFEDITGDGIPELICTRDGHFGFYRASSDKPLQPWKFVSISDDVAPKPFGHGLGVGDVNGDGRMDMLARNGWFEQPERYTDGDHWPFHAFEFARASADMFAYDVDGDGDSDIITSLSAHDFGLAWFENTGKAADGSVEFQRHLLMGEKAEESPYGVLFTELHAVKLADVNGDGLQDIITGKTYWSHHTKSPMWDAGAVVYWFELHRSEDGTADFIPHQADAEAGIGRGLTVADVNNDGLVDIVTGGMKGAHVLTHSRRPVSEAEWQEAQPRRRVAMAEGLEPAAAAAHMTVPPGFQVQLAAGEPMVHQPIAMCFDHKGRLWIAEAHTYPLRAEDGQGRDKILILEDTNQDGLFDRSKTFIEGLNLVSGLEVGFGGVFVGAAPYLMFIPDRNGDDIPDGPSSDQKKDPEFLKHVQFPKDVPAGAVVLRDGFGWQDTHETLNAFIWGPDGWLYGCHGVFTHSKVGHPGATAEDRLPLNAAVWRYHPQKDVFEAFMNGTSNPWGVDFNDQGQGFITACVIPHLWHVIQGARYHRQGGQHFNPYTYDDIKTIADHAHYVGNIRDHAWWGHEPKIADGTSEAGGGHAHAGAMVYLGDNWPDAYRNQIFFNNIHGNRVNCDILEREAGESGYVGHHGKDLLMANDHYFRGINLRYGADGSVYLIDWYDKNACHRTNPEIWDRTNGRIYRIVYGDATPVTEDLAQHSENELIDLMDHRNEWYVRTARRQLMHEGCSPAGQELLWKRTLDVTRPSDRRLRTLWTLHAVGGLTSEYAQQLLKDRDEYVRAWAIQLELEDQSASKSFVAQLEEMAKTEASAVVRMYLTSALQRLPPEQRWELAAALAGRAEDADDHNLPLLLWYGVEPLVQANAKRAVQLALSAEIDTVRRFVIRRASAQNDLIEPVVAALSSSNDLSERNLLLTEMLIAFEGRVDIPMPKAWMDAYEKVRLSGAASKSDSSDAEIARLKREVLDKADQIAVIFGDQRVFPPMRSLLTDPAQDLKRRQQALDVLVRGQDKASGDLLLTDSVLKNPELQGSAVRALVTLGGDRTPQVLLSAYTSFDEAVRKDVISTLVSRPAWTKMLLETLGSGQIPSSDLHAYHVRQILTFNNPELTDLLRKHWGEVREASADRQQQLADWKKVLTTQVLAGAHKGNGRRVFAKTCQNCHRLFGIGGEIGPDITGSNRANLDYILENILDPSAVVGRDYRMTVVALDDGRIVSGLLKQETDSALTIQTINDRVVVPKKQIEERSLSSISMMPERQLEALSRDEVRDLIAYLAAPGQVPLSGPPSPLDKATGKVPGAIEGEGMKVLEKSGGTVASQKMDGFPGDRWSGSDHLWWTGAGPGDRLALEVPVEEDGVYSLELAFTKARDYAIVKVSLGDQVLDAGLDCYNSPEVLTTGVLTYSNMELKKGSQRLVLEITGANPEAVRAYMTGLDYVRLVLVKTAGN